jgi:hypothetical protein
MQILEEGIIVGVLVEGLLERDLELNEALNELDLPKRASWRRQKEIGEKISTVEKIEAQIARLMGQIERRL